ncbi:carbohydrate ABC transporter substrate-binding protein (CUT1 family) [Motilibacter rhizosphaerae]|uniref:Carbohydrate ABC transporter substrate-binding protein (CUT1 family) n=1 Tax=Motilibacter rhizosphaerae TaxID=598652 RepID=A0A4Q7NNV9_9ACTN|nr:extracellular solute-binding protein [Motilibacter rhizosphaerae]RZS86853.1 carbohydrate ABC transporter substrate-binding protein (CUT1 family) [Motilibacter rhizosphaerae]
MDPTTSRRTFLRIAAGGAAAAGLAACGSSGPKSSTGSTGSGASAAPAGSSAAGASTGASAAAGGGSVTGNASYWFLNGQPQQGVRENQVKRFNSSHKGASLKSTEFQNDAYKQKIKTAIGAGQAPTLIWGWGGGGLKSYVDANQVVDLTDWVNGPAASLKSKIFPSAFGAATVNNKVYALPVETVTPIIFYYNKNAFEKIGAQPPQSWGDVMDLVPKFNAKGIAPFSLGGQSRWTNMMWLEFLLDRVGGSEVFLNVFNGQKGAWSDPSVEKMLTMVQDLVKQKGFIKGFSSITADSNADLAVFYSGKAAMMVHGAWTYGTMKSQGGNFVKSGALGYMNFPPVDGGKGDPSDTTGNPGQYLSISSKSSAEEQAVAKQFLLDNTLDDASIKDWVGTGAVPVVQGTRDQLAAQPDKMDSDWLTFNYDIASKAKVFQQSWDQALPPTQAEVLLDNIAKLFQLQVTPQQWISNMNAVIGK